VNNTYKSYNHDQVQKILVRVTNWIGDAVMNTPSLGAIRSTFPNAEITIVANPMVAQLFSPHPYCDRVLIFDKKGKDKGITGFLRFTESLRREQFDMAILLQKAFGAALMAFCSRIPVRIGYNTDSRSLLLTHDLPFTTTLKRLHHVEHYLKLVNYFNISGEDVGQRLFLTPEELVWARDILGNERWVVVNPGAAYGSAKRWLPERFAQVGNQLAKKNGMKVLLIGGPGETKIGHDIESELSNDCLNFIGKTSVRQMMALISCCQLMVTNDSGPMHIAAALNIPIVAVFGSTDHTTTYPAGVPHRIVRKEFDCAPCLLRKCPIDHRCMTSVTAEDVMSAVDDLNI